MKMRRVFLLTLKCNRGTGERAAADADADADADSDADVNAGGGAAEPGANTRLGSDTAGDIREEATLIPLTSTAAGLLSNTLLSAGIGSAAACGLGVSHISHLR